MAHRHWAQRHKELLKMATLDQWKVQSHSVVSCQLLFHLYSKNTICPTQCFYAQDLRYMDIHTCSVNWVVFIVKINISCFQRLWNKTQMLSAKNVSTTYMYPSDYSPIAASQIKVCYNRNTVTLNAAATPFSPLKHKFKWFNLSEFC